MKIRNCKFCGKFVKEHISLSMQFQHLEKYLHKPILSCKGKYFHRSLVDVISNDLLTYKYGIKATTRTKVGTSMTTQFYEKVRREAGRLLKGILNKDVCVYCLALRDNWYKCVPPCPICYSEPYCEFFFLCLIWNI